MNSIIYFGSILINMVGQKWHEITVIGPKWSPKRCRFVCAQFFFDESFLVVCNGRVKHSRPRSFGQVLAQVGRETTEIAGCDSPAFCLRGLDWQRRCWTLRAKMVDRCSSKKSKFIGDKSWDFVRFQYDFNMSSCKYWRCLRWTDQVDPPRQRRTCSPGHHRRHWSHETLQTRILP